MYQPLLVTLRTNTTIDFVLYVLISESYSWTGVLETERTIFVGFRGWPPDVAKG